MAGLVGKKIGMTSIYNEAGKNLPCTILEVGPCVATQIKTVEIDGYSAVQLAFDEKKEKSAIKAEIGHFKKANTTPKRFVKEYAFEGSIELGQVFDASIFTEGQFVDVTAKSKGKGFQGVVKRHGFGGVGQATHGQHNRLRAPGSIGAASYPARVFKGMKMAGQMGNKTITTQNLQVLKVMADKNLIVLKGAVPGPKGGYVSIER